MSTLFLLVHIFGWQWGIAVEHTTAGHCLATVEASLLPLACVADKET